MIIYSSLSLKRLFFQEGRNNEKFDSHPRHPEDLPAYLLVHNNWYNGLDLVISLILLSLAFVEEPALPLFKVRHALINDIPFFSYRYISCICFAIGTSGSTRYGRVACINYYRCAISFKAEMDWLGTYVATQTYDVEGKIPLTRNILMQKFEKKKETECSTIVWQRIYKESVDRKTDYLYNRIIRVVSSFVHLSLMIIMQRYKSIRQCVLIDDQRPRCLDE